MSVIFSDTGTQKELNISTEIIKIFMLKGVFAKNKRGYSLILKSIESTQIKRVFNLTYALSTKLSARVLQ